MSENIIEKKKSDENTMGRDLGLSVVVMKNEISKFFHGKKMQLFFGLMIAVLVIITAIPYLVGETMSSDSKSILMVYSMFASIVVMLAGILFSATSVVSEFEEHTALILFTRPIKKSSIFIGKFLASFVVCFAFIALYYAVAATVSMVQSGSIDSNLPASFGLSIAYTFGMVGLSLMISSISKKGSTASILTVVFVILLLPVISQVLLLCNIDASWIFTQASNAISNIFTGSNADVGMSAAVMIAWGVICGTLSYFLFRRRDF